jgi:hypothetical protein
MTGFLMATGVSSLFSFFYALVVLVLIDLDYLCFSLLTLFECRVSKLVLMGGGEAELWSRCHVLGAIFICGSFKIK